MLKGSAHTLSNFMAGTFIFVLAFVAIYLALMVPLSMMGETKLGGENEVRAIDVSNMLRTHILYNIGNEKGDIDYHSLDGQEPQAEAAGISDNYFRIEDLLTGRYWEFEGKRERDSRHEVFTTISNNFIPVPEKSVLLMEKGSDYIIHIYRLSAEGDIAVDVYGGRSCSPTGRTGDSYGAYMLLGCDEIRDLQMLDVDSAALREQITHVRNTEDAYFVSWVRPESDITPGDLMVSGMRFGDTTECLELRKERMCFRIMGDFVTPARIITEMGRKFDITVDYDAYYEVIGAERDAQEVLEAINYANSRGGVQMRTCQCGTSCSDYASWVVKYSEQYNIPDPLLPLSMMMQESGCKQQPVSGGNFCNSLGYCGLMQISSSVPGYSDPEINIREGIKLLREKYDSYSGGMKADGCLKTLDYSGWAAAVRGYVGWGCAKSWRDEYDANPGNEANVAVMKEHDNYVESVMSRYEELKRAVSG